MRIASECTRPGICSATGPAKPGCRVEMNLRPCPPSCCSSPIFNERRKLMAASPRPPTGLYSSLGATLWELRLDDLQVLDLEVGQVRTGPPPSVWNARRRHVAMNGTTPGPAGVSQAAPRGGGGSPGDRSRADHCAD